MRIPMKLPGYNEERFSLGGAAHDLSATISRFSSIDHRRRVSVAGRPHGVDRSSCDPVSA